MAKTRIIVLKLKKLLRIAVPTALALVLLILLLVLFVSPKNDTTDNGEPQAPAVATYHAGVYSSVIELGDSFLNLEVIVDTDHINSVRLVNLDEATAAMYPLMEPAAADISAQLASGTSLDEVTLSESSKYTQTLLLEGVRSTLEKAILPEE